MRTILYSLVCLIALGLTAAGVVVVESLSPEPGANMVLMALPMIALPVLVAGSLPVAVTHLGRNSLRPNERAAGRNVRRLDFFFDMLGPARSNVCSGRQAAAPRVTRVRKAMSITERNSGADDIACLPAGSSALLWLFGIAGLALACCAVCALALFWMARRTAEGALVLLLIVLLSGMALAVRGMDR